MKHPTQQTPLQMAQAKTPVLFTMGKVASSAITQAFISAGIECHHIHNLNPETLKALAKPNIEAGCPILKHVRQSQAHRSEYLEHPERFLFISLIRDPVARNISAYFQNLHISEQKTGIEPDIEKLFEQFVSTYTHRLPLRWFDRQFRDQLGGDVYKYRFYKKMRFRYLPKQNTLLLRIDCPRVEKETILSDIFKRPIVISDVNVGEQKDYGARYKAFKDRARFDDAFLNRIYNSAFCRHFWTNRERAEMRMRWTM